MRARVKGINLLPREYIQAEQVKFVQIIISVVLVLEVFAFIGGIAIPPKLEEKKVQQQLEEISNKLNDSRFADVNKTIQELEVAKADVEQWVNKYGDLKQENFVSGRVLDSLTSRLPIGIVIDKMEIKPGEKNTGKETEVGEGNSEKGIKIEGSSEELESIINYATILESAYGVGNIYYEGEYDKELGVYKYVIEVKNPVVTISETEAIPSSEVAPSTETIPPAEGTEGGTN